VFDFANSPTIGQTVSNGGVSYIYDGTKWTATPNSGGDFVNVSGDTMTGPLVLSGDPTASAQAANKHYIDNAISLAGNYLGTWQVAANTPSITAGGSVSNANYVAVTANPVVPETAPGGIPGIAGQTVNNGDRIIWAAGISQWQILRSPSPNVSSFNTRTGAVTLSSGDVTTVLPPSSTTPVMDGTAAIGSGTTWARADHVHPTDTSRYAASNPSGYQTAAQVTTALAPYAPLAAPVFTGDARAVTPALGDNDTSIATTAFVQAALPAASYANNTGFAVNQRAYVSGTALAAGVYGHDRWKAGAGGGTYTFTQSPGAATTITVTAGTLQQVVEGISLLTGNYVLSWTGSAQARINAGSYGASPRTASLTAGTNATIEFQTGTVGQVKLEIGTTATPWTAPAYADELRSCMRFYQGGPVGFGGVANGSATNVFVMQLLPVPMRASPTLTFASGAGSNVSGQTVNGNGYSAITPICNVSAAGFYYFNGTFTALAEL